MNAAAPSRWILSRRATVPDFPSPQPIRLARRVAVSAVPAAVPADNMNGSGYLPSSALPIPEKTRQNQCSAKKIKPV